MLRAIHATDGGYQMVAGDQQASVKPEHFQNQLGDGLAGRSASRH
jgi:hypothetical protein